MFLGVRQRGAVNNATSSINSATSGGDNDLDKVIDYHRDRQEMIANDMLSLTRNLREQSELANKIIKKDTVTVGRSMQLTEKNFGKLKQESEVLAEHTKRSCKCWMWMILMTVLIVFICKC